MDHIAPDRSTNFLRFQKLTVKEVTTGLAARGGTEVGPADAERRRIEQDSRRGKDQLRRRPGQREAVLRTVTIGPYFLDRKLPYTHIDRAITEVRSSEEQHRHVADPVAKLVWTVDIEGRTARPDQQGFGYGAPIERDDPPKLCTLIYPDDVSRALQQWDYAKAPGEVPELDFRLRYAADKKYRRHPARLAPIPEASQFVAKWIGTAMNIDQRKRREELVRQSEAKLRAYFEAVPHGILTLGMDGRIEEVNHRAAQMFGYRHEELVGQTLEKLLPERFRAAHAAHRAAYFSNPRQRPVGEGLDLTGVRKDGTEFPIDVALSLASTNRGPFAIALIFDMRARKKLEQQFCQTQKLESLGILAAGVAHVFNNLLTVVLGNASLLATELPESKLVLGRVQEIVRASERAADLTRQLLVYAGKGQSEIVAVNCSDLLRSVGTLSAGRIPKQVELRLQLSQALPLVLADVNLTQQLVANLIINGAEAIGESAGTVDVRTAVLEVDAQYLEDSEGFVDQIVPGRYVVIEVEDTGCGMDDQTKARIFDPFFTTKFTGRGLGLAAVRGIIQTNKGGLQVHSATGRGTIFRVFLPVAENELSFRQMAVPMQRDSDLQRRHSRRGYPQPNLSHPA